MLLGDDEIEAIIREAFRPCRCVDILPGRLISFHVIKQCARMAIYTEPGIPIEPLREVSDLRELLRTVRLLFAKRGYQLSP
jgi:hypothetical protein